MKIKNIAIRNLFLGLFTATLVLTACKKTDLMEAPRLFRPVLKGSLVSDANYITASWQAIKGAKNYTLQLSRDTFKTIDLSIDLDTTAYTINNLKWNQLYQLQVRANAPDSSHNSGMSDLGSIKTPKFPSILNTPTLSDVTDEAIRVSWKNGGAAVTSIKLLNPTDSSILKDVALTSTDVTNQYKIISALKSNTTFLVALYSGTTPRGYELFTTKAALTGTIVDLRSITDRPSVLADTLPLVDAGTTILLKRGMTYNIATTVSVSKAVTIQSGSDLTVTDPAKIYFTSTIAFAAGSNVDYIDFKDLYLYGAAYGTNYVFNTTTSANVGRISFENVRAEIFRGLVRLQSAGITVSNFVVNNCILDSLSGYGVITVDNAGAKADNITIKNSTIYKAEKIVTSKAASTSVTLDALTVNEAPFGTGNYVVDYNGVAVTNPVVVKNCIFGIGKTSSGSIAVRGIRVTGSVDASNNYNTADYVLQATTPNPIPSLTAYTKKSTEIWQDPYNGNFRIIDANFPGKNSTGDPRWRP
jgi:hypothetical protein